MRHSRVACLAVGLIAAACSSSDNNTGTQPGVTPYRVTVVSGSGQTSTTGATLLIPLTVLVTDTLGAPVKGITVTWQAVGGGGSVTPPSSVTDSAGHAATGFTLGSVAGPQTAVASVATGISSATFNEVASSPIAGAQLITSVAAPVGSTYDHDTYVRDGLAFAFMWNSGVRIYDVGNGIKGGSPSNPVFVSSLVTNLNGVSNPDVHNGWWFHNPVSGQNKYLFIGQEGPGSVPASSSGDIHIVDVSDLTHPVEVGFIHVAGAGVHNFWMDEASQTLYAAYYNAGVAKIDVSGTLSGDMSNRIVKRVQPGGAGNTYVWGVMLANGTLYATDMVTGFWALDPATLAVKGGGNNVPDRFGSDQWVFGNWAYSGTWGNSPRKTGNAVKIWSLDPATGAPTLADSIIIPNVGTISDVAVTPDGKLLVVTAEQGSAPGLYVYSRANPASPTLVGSYVVSVGEHTGEVAVINGRTYVFAARDPGQQQMDIFDITSLIPQ